MSFLLSDILLVTQQSGSQIPSASVSVKDAPITRAFIRASIHELKVSMQLF